MSENLERVLPVSVHRASALAAGMTVEVQRRLTEEFVQQIHRQRVVHRSRGVTDSDLTLLWPLGWVSVEYVTQFLPARFMGLPMALATVEGPVVVSWR